jgi:hypothetical protein
MKLSVIICTHNPRPDYLARTLDALRLQTTGMAEWELLLIDNGSHPAVAALTSLTWHPKRPLHHRESSWPYSGTPTRHSRGTWAVAHLC